jgi:hypothetical protein
MSGTRFGTQLKREKNQTLAFRVGGTKIKKNGK